MCLSAKTESSDNIRVFVTRENLIAGGIDEERIVSREVGGPHPDAKMGL
jgi:hypothetical protein